jgi:biopolymer transport protein ExbB/TolQ
VSYLLIPLILLILIGVVLVIFAILAALSRIQNGRFLRPIIETLSKIPWLKKQFTKISQAAIERSNPELASAMRKLQRVGPNPDPKRAQAAMQSLSQGERRAYEDFAEAQGTMPEGANREQRRKLARYQQTSRPRAGTPPPSSKRKKR